MCTLSWARTEKIGYRLLFNRDESLQRPVAQPPTSIVDGGREFIAPIDPVGGGTWIATNDRGLTICILNDYQGAPPELARRDPRSRGLLVRELATCRDEREVSERIAQMDLESYRPFSLVAFGLVHGPFVWHHHAGGLTLRLCPRAPITSSGEAPDRVQLHRRAAWDRLNQKHGSPLSLDVMRSFHRGDHTDAGSLSAAMSRPGRGTVSVTEVEVSPGQTRLAYFPGHPSETRLKSPTTKVTLRHESSTTPLPKVSSIQPGVFSLESLFAEKNPPFHAKIPRAAFAVLDKVVGTARINRALHELGPIAPQVFPERALGALAVEGRVRFSHEPVCRTAPAPIYVANHPLGGVDGLALLTLVRHLHGDVVALINDVLLRIPHAQSFGVGIDKSRTRKALAAAVAQTFASGAPVLIFPAGKTSRKAGGALQDPPWGRMVVVQALRHQRPIVPVFVHGENSRLFYGIHRLRRALGITANLEMFLLPREVMQPSIEKIDLVVGESLSPDELRALGSTDPLRAQALRGICYALSQRLPEVRP